MSADEPRASESNQRSLLLYLLIALVFNLMVAPVAEYGTWGRWMLGIGFTAVLLTAAVATRRRRSLLILGLVAAAIVAPISWIALFYDQPVVFLIHAVLAGLLFVATAVFILVSVVRKHLATIDSIFGAISAYLLLGLAWAVVYWGVDRAHPDVFRVADRAPAYQATLDADSRIPAFSQFVYFSFVTMSTLGYGDICPQTPIIQTAAWMQSVVGQFYIAVLVAWLVSEIPSRRNVKT